MAGFLSRREGTWVCVGQSWWRSKGLMLCLWKGKQCQNVGYCATFASYISGVTKEHSFAIELYDSMAASFQRSLERQPVVYHTLLVWAGNQRWLWQVVFQQPELYYLKETHGGVFGDHGNETCGCSHIFFARLLMLLPKLVFGNFQRSWSCC